MNVISYIISPMVALLLSPLMVGIINKTKAAFAGRQGQPLLQAYYDIFRLLRKGVVYSKTTTWVFRVAPTVIFCCTLAATCFVPFVSGSQFSFLGDVVLLLYLLGLARFFIILSAMDTGSAFEGMGASREAFFSALAEPAMFICVINIMRSNATSSIVTALSLPMTPSILALLVTIPLFLILLAENARIPFDDPNTHLELTMIHEVMILDNSGPGLALMEYAAAIKLWLFSLIIGRILLPASVVHPAGQIVLLLGLMILIAIAVGVVESVTARVRLLKVPRLLFTAFILALLGFFLSVNNVFSW